MSETKKPKRFAKTSEVELPKLAEFFNHSATRKMREKQGKCGILVRAIAAVVLITNLLDITVADTWFLQNRSHSRGEASFLSQRILRLIILRQPCIKKL